MILKSTKDQFYCNTSHNSPKAHGKKTANKNPIINLYTYKKHMLVAPINMQIIQKTAKTRGEKYQKDVYV